MCILNFTDNVILPSSVGVSRTGVQVLTSVASLVFFFFLMLNVPIVKK